jgi:HTH-type transcriptional regulator/antitoxin HigA
MEIRPIHTKKDHTKALAEVERLIALDPKRGTAECDALEVISVLVERYEKEHFPIEPPTPIEAVEFRMDQEGLRQADLVPYFGSRSRVSEVLSGKRQLTIDMIRSLHEGLGIPLRSLVGETRAPQGGRTKRTYTKLRGKKRGDERKRA